MIFHTFAAWQELLNIIFSISLKSKSMLMQQMLIPAHSPNFFLSVQNFFTFQVLRLLKSLPESVLVLT